MTAQRRPHQAEAPLLAAARRYMQQRGDDGETYYRYDIISVTMPGKRPTAIDHIENAFGADD